MAAAPKLPQLASGQLDSYRSKPWSRKIFSKGPRLIGNDEDLFKARCACTCGQAEACGVLPVVRKDLPEKALDFMEKQRSAVLESLQEEVQRLKAENKDLSFKLLFGAAGSEVKDLSQSAIDSTVDAGQSDIRVDRIEVLQQEVAHLRGLLKWQSAHGERLQHYSEHMTTLLGRLRPQPVIGQPSLPPISTQAVTAQRQPHIVLASGKKGTWPGSSEQCHKLLDDLQQQNDTQAHELLRLKTDLHDLLTSHKWSPEAFLLARAYITGNDIDKRPSRRGTMPPITAASLSSTLRPHDELALPALKPTVGKKAIDRQKNIQAVQKARQQRLPQY